jgi:hypothetical protein
MRQRSLSGAKLGVGLLFLVLGLVPLVLFHSFHDEAAEPHAALHRQGAGAVSQSHQARMLSTLDAAPSQAQAAGDKTIPPKKLHGPDAAIDSKSGPIPVATAENGGVAHHEPELPPLPNAGPESPDKATGTASNYLPLEGIPQEKLTGAGEEAHIAHGHQPTSDDVGMLAQQSGASRESAVHEGVTSRGEPSQKHGTHVGCGEVRWPDWGGESRADPNGVACSLHSAALSAVFSDRFAYAPGTLQLSGAFDAGKCYVFAGGTCWEAREVGGAGCAGAPAGGADEDAVAREAEEAEEAEGVAEGEVGSLVRPPPFPVLTGQVSSLTSY